MEFVTLFRIRGRGSVTQCMSTYARGSMAVFSCTTLMVSVTVKKVYDIPTPHSNANMKAMNSISTEPAP